MWPAHVSECVYPASIAAQPPLVGGRRLSRSPTAATAAAGPRRRPRGCCSSSQRLPLATRGVRTRVWGRVVHRLDAGRAQRPPVGAARASEAVALWAFRGAPIASRNSPTLTLGHRRYAREYFSDLFCMTCLFSSRVCISFARVAYVTGSGSGNTGVFQSLLYKLFTCLTALAHTRSPDASET